MPFLLTEKVTDEVMQLIQTGTALFSQSSRLFKDIIALVHYFSAKLQIVVTYYHY